MVSGNTVQEGPRPRHDRSVQSDASAEVLSYVVLCCVVLCCVVLCCVVLCEQLFPVTLRLTHLKMLRSHSFLVIRIKRQLMEHSADRAERTLFMSSIVCIPSSRCYAHGP